MGPGSNWIELAIKQIGSHLDQADDHIGGDGRIVVFNASAKGVVVGARLPVQFTQSLRIRMVEGPFLQSPHAQEVALVLQQLFQAGPRYDGEFDLHFLGGSGRLAPLKNILFPGTCSLHHLVIGAVVLIEEPCTEAYCSIVDDLGFLKGKQVLVASMRGSVAIVLSVL